MTISLSDNSITGDDKMNTTNTWDNNLSLTLTINSIQNLYSCIDWYQEIDNPKDKKKKLHDTHANNHNLSSPHRPSSSANNHSDSDTTRTERTMTISIVLSPITPHSTHLPPIISQPLIITAYNSTTTPTTSSSSLYEYTFHFHPTERIHLLRSYLHNPLHLTLREHKPSELQQHDTNHNNTQKLRKTSVISKKNSVNNHNKSASSSKHTSSDEVVGVAVDNESLESEDIRVIGYSSISLISLLQSDKQYYHALHTPITLHPTAYTTMQVLHSLHDTSSSSISSSLPSSSALIYSLSQQPCSIVTEDDIISNNIVTIHCKGIYQLHSRWLDQHAVTVWKYEQEEQQLLLLQPQQQQQPPQLPSHLHHTTTTTTPPPHSTTSNKPMKRVKKQEHTVEENDYMDTVKVELQVPIDVNVNDGDVVTHTYQWVNRDQKIRFTTSTSSDPTHPSSGTTTTTVFSPYVLFSSDEKEDTQYITSSALDLWRHATRNKQYLPLHITLQRSLQKTPHQNPIKSSTSTSTTTTLPLSAPTSTSTTHEFTVHGIAMLDLSTLLSINENDTYPSSITLKLPIIQSSEPVVLPVDPPVSENPENHKSNRRKTMKKPTDKDLVNPSTTTLLSPLSPTPPPPTISTLPLLHETSTYIEIEVIFQHSFIPHKPTITLKQVIDRHLYISRLLKDIEKVLVETEDDGNGTTLNVKDLISQKYPNTLLNTSIQSLTTLSTYHYSLAHLEPYQRPAHQTIYQHVVIRILQDLIENLAKMKYQSQLYVDDVSALINNREKNHPPMDVYPTSTPPPTDRLQRFVEQCIQLALYHEESEDYHTAEHYYQQCIVVLEERQRKETDDISKSSSVSIHLSTCYYMYGISYQRHRRDSETSIQFLEYAWKLLNHTSDDPLLIESEAPHSAHQKIRVLLALITLYLNVSEVEAVLPYIKQLQRCYDNASKQHDTHRTPCITFIRLVLAIYHLYEEEYDECQQLMGPSSSSSSRTHQQTLIHEFTQLFPYTQHTYLSTSYRNAVLYSSGSSNINTRHPNNTSPLHTSYNLLLTYLHLLGCTRVSYEVYRTSSSSSMIHMNDTHSYTHMDAVNQNDRSYMDHLLKTYDDTLLTRFSRVCIEYGDVEEGRWLLKGVIERITSQQDDKKEVNDQYDGDLYHLIGDTYLALSDTSSSSSSSPAETHHRYIQHALHSYQQWYDHQHSDSRSTRHHTPDSPTILRYLTLLMKYKDDDHHRGQDILPLIIQRLSTVSSSSSNHNNSSNSSRSNSSTVVNPYIYIRAAEYLLLYGDDTNDFDNKILPHQSHLLSSSSSTRHTSKRYHIIHDCLSTASVIDPYNIQIYRLLTINELRETIHNQRDIGTTEDITMIDSSSQKYRSSTQSHHSNIDDHLRLARMYTDRVVRDKEYANVNGSHNKLFNQIYDLWKQVGNEVVVKQLEYGQKNRRRKT